MKVHSFVPFELADGEDHEIQILKWGSFHHARFGKFDVTPEHGRQMVDNLARELAQGHERFVTIGHPAKLDGEPAAGWVRGLRLAADGVFATIKLLPETAARIKAGAYRYFSPTFTTAGKDESGKPIGAQLLSGAITNDPFLKGMRPFALSAAVAAEDDDMSDEIKALSDERDALTLKLSEAETQVKTLSEQVATLTSERDASGEQVKTLSAEVDALKLAAAQSDARSAINDALKSGRLAPADLDAGWDADPIKALSDAGFAGVDGFKAQMKRRPANSRVDLSATKGDGSADTQALSLSDPAHPEILALSKASGVKPEYLAAAAKRREDAARASAQ